MSSGILAAVALALLSLIALLAMPKKAGAAVPAVTGSTPAVPRYPYFSEVQAAAKKHGISAALLAAVVSWEQRSDVRWDPNAVNPADPSYGLGQVTPYIGKRFGAIDSEANFAGLFIPEKNLDAAAAFLAYLLNRNGRDAAIQMYNLGEPKYWAGARVPAYLNGVLGYLDKFEG